MNATFFKTAARFRTWLEKNHDRASELWVGFYKAASGRGGMTYKEALDEALCFGWIDGIRKRLDEDSYVQRFTPRRPKSYWSAVNTRRMGELIAEGRMHPVGLAVFERRDKTSAGKYSFEQNRSGLDDAQTRRFKANAKAWNYFEAEAPWYRRVAAHWVTSAKKEETRARRLETLIADSAAGRRIRGVPVSHARQPQPRSGVRRGHSS